MISRSSHGRIQTTDHKGNQILSILGKEFKQGVQWSSSVGLYPRHLNQPNEALLPWLIAMLDPSAFMKPVERPYPLRCRYSECICCCEDCCWLFSADCACWSCCICWAFKDWLCIWNTRCPPTLKLWPEPLLISPVAIFKRCTSSRSASCNAVTPLWIIQLEPRELENHCHKLH